MAEYGLTFGIAILLWWLGTGLVVLLSGQTRRRTGWALVAATLGLGAALAGVFVSARHTGVAGAYGAFLAALAVWGWVEMTFLTGRITGPRKQACPPGVSGWQRFKLATATLLWHELMLTGGLVVVAALSWGAPNQFGTLAYLVLFAMRISAKLNIFFGVPNFTDDLLPARLDYLRSYFRKDRPTWFFPMSVTAGVFAAVSMALRAFDPALDAFAATGWMLVFGLTALAVFEHLFMIVPIRDASLWRWAMPAALRKPNGKASS